MKILIFTHVFPYPLNEGGKVAQFGFLEYLCKGNEVVLVTENNYENLSKDAESLNKIIPSLRIELLLPKKQVAQTGTTAHLLKMVKKVEWRLKRRLLSKYPRPKKIVDNAFFMKPVHLKSYEIINQFLKSVEREKPDIIQIDFVDNADLVNVLPVGIPKILIHHDLRFASVGQAALLEGKNDIYSKYLSSYVSTIEAAFLDKFNAIITFSTDDKNKLLPFLTKAKVVAIPFPVLDKSMVAINNKTYYIDKLIFIGPEHHTPNYDAVDWYATTMAELIFSKFKIKLVVIGKWALESVTRYSKMEGIEFAGFVEDINTISANSIMLVPVRIGSGIRTKLLDAFAFGIPVISTTLGSEGLGVENEQELLLADTPEQFITAIEKLLVNPKQVTSIRNTANHFVKANYSQQSISDKRMCLYEQLVKKEVV